MAIRNSNGSGWGILGAVGAALASSSCCTVPFALVSAGVGGAWLSNLTALEPYRPLFIAGAVVFLGIAFNSRYKSSRNEDCNCEPTGRRKPGSAFLTIGAILTLGLILSPWLLSVSTSGESAAAHSPGSSESVLEVVLQVDGMTCETCPATVKTALERLNGVVGANVTFEPPLATIKFDGLLVSVSDLIEATSNAGYPSEQIQPAPK